MLSMIGKSIQEVNGILQQAPEWKGFSATYFKTGDGGFKMRYEPRGNESMSTQELLDERYLIELFVYENYFNYFENDMPFELTPGKPFKECLKGLKKRDDIQDLDPDKNKNYIEFIYTGMSPYSDKNGIAIRLEFHWGDSYPFRSIELKKPE